MLASEPREGIFFARASRTARSCSRLFGAYIGVALLRDSPRVRPCLGVSRIRRALDSPEPLRPIGAVAGVPVRCLEQVADTPSIVVAKMDADAHVPPEQFKVQAYPTLMFLKVRQGRWRAALGDIIGPYSFCLPSYYFVAFFSLSIVHLSSPFVIIQIHAHHTVTRPLV